MDSIELRARAIEVRIWLPKSNDPMCQICLLVNGVEYDKYAGHTAQGVCLRLLQALRGESERYRFIRQRKLDNIVACQPGYQRQLRVIKQDGGGVLFRWAGEREFLLTPDECGVWKKQLMSWLVELRARFVREVIN